MQVTVNMCAPCLDALVLRTDQVRMLTYHYISTSISIVDHLLHDLWTDNRSRVGGGRLGLGSVLYLPYG